jgi:CheY-like chemotaxis protein
LGESDPKQALALAEESLPEIIVLDMMLPDVDGWELLGRFRAHPRIGDSSVIVCTILPQKQLALSLGAADFLSKPLSRQNLLSALNTQADRLH